MAPHLDPPPPSSAAVATTTTTTVAQQPNLLEDHHYSYDSTSSSPYVSAPSSPIRGGGFFYSAPSSPMHFVLLSSTKSSSFAPSPSDASSTATSGSFEFEFDFSKNDAVSSPAMAENEIGAAMSSADELFLNGQIRPMKLSAHLQRPQIFVDNVGEGERKERLDQNDDVFVRSRDLRLRDKSLRRRTRSLSPLRSTTPFDWCNDDEDDVITAKDDRVTAQTKEDSECGNGEIKRSGSENQSNETTPSCSSANRSSRRWIFLRDFLRSKSEGRNNVKFWHTISFSPIKEKRTSNSSSISNQSSSNPPEKSKKRDGKRSGKAAASATGGKRRVAVRSAHELHYAANRAQAEEMRKKTFLPYRQGLLGCLGFNSKSYGAINGFARALNPVSSR